jgi:hypothetical protein
MLWPRILPKGSGFIDTHDTYSCQKADANSISTMSGRMDILLKLRSGAFLYFGCNA